MSVRYDHLNNKRLETYERGIFGWKRLEHNLHGRLYLSDARASHRTAAIDEEHILLTWEWRKIETGNQSQRVRVRRLLCSLAWEVTLNRTTRMVELLGRNKDNDVFFQEIGGFM